MASTSELHFIQVLTGGDNNPTDYRTEADTAGGLSKAKTVQMQSGKVEGVSLEK